MRRRDCDAHRALADTARMVRPAFEQAPRERRKPSTVGARETRAATEVARDVFAERQLE